MAIGAAVYFGRNATRESVPEVEFLTPQGQKFQLSQGHGKVILLHFWAVWCAPCAEEMPKLLKLAAELQKEAPEKVGVVAVSLDPKWEDSQRLLARRDATLSNWQNVWDPSLKSAERLGSFQFPETYVLGPTGEIAIKWVGPQDWQRPEIKSFLLGLAP